MDIILRGGIAGVVGYATCSAVSLILYLLHLLPYTGVHYNIIFFHATETPLTTLTWATGIIAGFVTGAFVGVVIAYLIDRTGYDYSWLKGLGVGIVLWPVHVAIIPNLFAHRLYSVLPPIMVFACFFFEAIYGIVTGIMVKYLYDGNKIKLKTH